MLLVAGIILIISSIAGFILQVQAIRERQQER